MENEVLKRLQTTEMEILDVLDSFCARHGIQYSLAAGTAIGAIRHQGFIPWDDDIDIAMSRTEYNKFCRAWKQNPIDGYYLENYLDDKYCGTSHAKLRKDGTVMLSEGEDEKHGHHGIWVDIFPCDKIPKDEKKTNQIIKYGRRVIFFTRANVISYNDDIVKKLVRYAIRLIPYAVRHRLLLEAADWLVKNNEKIDGDYEWISMSTLGSLSIRYHQNLMDETIRVKFEDREYNIFREYDDMLRCLYGDYMTLPPIEERVCKHAPIKLEFEKR